MKIPPHSETIVLTWKCHYICAELSWVSECCFTSLLFQFLTAPRISLCVAWPSHTWHDLEIWLKFFLCAGILPVSLVPVCMAVFKPIYEFKSPRGCCTCAPCHGVYNSAWGCQCRKMWGADWWWCRGACHSLLKVIWVCRVVGTHGYGDSPALPVALECALLTEWRRGNIMPLPLLFKKVKDCS